MEVNAMFALAFSHLYGSPGSSIEQETELLTDVSAFLMQSACYTVILTLLWRVSRVLWSGLGLASPAWTRESLDSRVPINSTSVEPTDCPATVKGWRARLALKTRNQESNPGLWHWKCKTLPLSQALLLYYKTKDLGHLWPCYIRKTPKDGTLVICCSLVYFKGGCWSHYVGA